MSEQTLKQKQIQKEDYIFPITPIAAFRNRPYPKTAACLIIGDEILNGKTVDTNSVTFAKYCFEHGIDLKRIEVIPDEEDVIIEAVRRLSNSFDFVITSGGVGPTHDDITYPSISKAFNLSLKYHQPTLDRMDEYIKNTPLRFMKSKPNQKVAEASKRMASFPDHSIIVYPNEKLWVPIVIVNENVHILPGIPDLFKGLLFEFSKYLKVRQNGNDGEAFYRKFVKTFRPESYIAPILTEIHEKVKDMGIKVGSYPKWTDNRWVVLVSFLTRKNNKEKVDELCKQVAERINGVIMDNPEDEVVNKDSELSVKEHKL